MWRACLYHGLRLFGPARAESYLARIKATFALLQQFPHLGAERAGPAGPIRIHHHRRHYILYAVRADHILILRIVRDEAELAALISRLD